MSKYQPLADTGLSIPPLVFGGNVFGWTLDEKSSFSMIDALLERGFNTIDTADIYSAWAPGNQGGESETIIGNWLRDHPGKRDQLVLFTKVGAKFSEQRGGLSKRWITTAVEDSLRRLNTDYIDLYFSHWPDENTPYEETLEAYQGLLAQGKIRSIGASNLNATQLKAALTVAGEQQLPRYQVLQPEYNLYDRASFEGELQQLCQQHKIGVVTYFSLASGFLSGKYRTKADLAERKRAAMVEKYLDDKGMKILAALDDVAKRVNATQAEVALAWLIHRPGVSAPIASTTSLAQLNSLSNAVALELSDADMQLLTQAGD